MLNAPTNPNGKPNSDIVKPWVNGLDITRNPRGIWIIDFGDMLEHEAALYEIPFEYVKKVVKPERDQNNRDRRKRYWWQHGETSPGMHAAIDPLIRFIGTPSLSKHRLFVWLEHPTLPDHQIVVFARIDDYFFGILHSKLHEIWALKQGTSLEDRPRYSPTSTFETFPFPWAPSKEPKNDPRVQAISQAAKELVEQRDRWLNAASQVTVTFNVTVTSGDEQPKVDKKRTLTNLYNQRPTWLDLAHKRLDEAVFAAYGWKSDLSDEEILEKLLALNLERAR